MIGLRFQMWMTGTYYLFAAPLDERAIAIRADVTLRDVRRVLGERTGDVNGAIDVAGLATGRALSGTLRYLLDEKRVPYDLVFTSDEGRTVRLRGQHDLQWTDPWGSLTTVPVSLYDASGEEIGRAILRVDPGRDLVPSLRSLRPVLRLGRAPGKATRRIKEARS